MAFTLASRPNARLRCFRAQASLHEVMASNAIGKLQVVGLPAGNSVRGATLSRGWIPLSEIGNYTRIERQVDRRWMRLGGDG